MIPGEAIGHLATANAISARRRNALVAFSLALLLLLLAMVAFVSWRHDNERARIGLVEAQQQALVARQQQLMVAKKRALQALSTQLAERANVLGLAPQQWSERRINVRQQPVQRDVASDILVGTGRGNGRLFAVEAFDLSVTRPEESLFQVPEDERQPLRMTMRGTALFGTGER